jgi:hypothetical protein
MIVTPEMVKAVKEATCCSCGAMVYENCQRHPQRDCGREHFGGTRAATPGPLETEGPTLGVEEMLFLRAVDQHGPTFRTGLPSSNRAQDRARQRCKKLNMVKFNFVLGWQITAAGRRAIVGTTK